MNDQPVRALRPGAGGLNRGLLAEFGLTPEPWTVDALCAETDPEAFFPEKGGSTREAKKVCASCDVRTQCLEYALRNDERFGIWGGVSERDRRNLKRGIPLPEPRARKPRVYSNGRVDQLWSEADDQFLRANYLAMRDVELARALGRQLGAVVRRRSRLSLRRRGKSA